MALLWFDGFDTYGTSGGLSDTPAITEYSTISTTYPAIYSSTLTPSYRIRGLVYTSSSADGSTNLLWSLPSTYTSGSFGVGMHVMTDTTVASTGDYPFIVLMGNGTTNIAGVGLHDTKVTAWVGNNRSGTLYTSTLSLSASTLYHIEIGVSVGSSGSDTLEVRINGQTVISETGLTLGSITGVDFMHSSWTSPSPSGYYFDDVFIWDGTGSENNDFLGDRIVQTLFPTADTTQADWTLSTGTDGYALIDNVPPNGDDDYLSSDTAADVSEFDLDDLDNANVTVSGIKVTGLFSKSDTGDTTVEVGVTDGTTDTYGDAFTPSLSSWRYTSFLQEQNPTTSANWTATEVNALKLAVKRVT